MDNSKRSKNSKQDHLLGEKCAMERKLASLKHRSICYPRNQLGLQRLIGREQAENVKQSSVQMGEGRCFVTATAPSTWSHSYFWDPDGAASRCASASLG